MTLTTVNYTNPSSGSKVIFYDDGSSQLTQAVAFCDPSSPDTPLGTADNPLPVSLEEGDVTLAHVLAAVKEGNEILLAILTNLENK